MPEMFCTVHWLVSYVTTDGGTGRRTFTATSPAPFPVTTDFLVATEEWLRVQQPNAVVLALMPLADPPASAPEDPASPSS